MFWLIDEHLKDLAMIDTIRAQNQEAEYRRRLDREEAECCYALAVLIKDPPAVSSAEVAQYVKDAGRAEQVKPYLDKVM